jgi:hypothetical protein
LQNCFFALHLQYQNNNDMTVKEELTARLTERGMSKQQAESVMQLAIPKIQKLADNYEVTFDRPKREYDPIVIVMLWHQTKKVALEWIDENKPQAWFRDIFVN